MDAVPLCAPWPVTGCADLSPYPAEVTGVGFMAASEILWSHSGRQFGECQVTFRPCARRCLEQPYGGWWWTADAWSSGWPYGPASGGWLAALCGSCGSACSCTAAAELRLPVAARAVSQVSVDGVVLDPGVYQLYNGTILVRGDGQRWPFCQDWAAASGVGVFQITATYGQPVPTLGALAMGELLPEVLKACVGAPGCRLPGSVVEQISRQGVSKRFRAPPAGKREADFGLPLVNAFLASFNPDGLRAGAKIWNPDDVAARRTDGPWP